MGKFNYFSILTDGSAEKSVVEQEAMKILFMIDGASKIRYLSIESVKNEPETDLKF